MYIVSNFIHMDTTQTTKRVPTWFAEQVVKVSHQLKVIYISQEELRNLYDSFLSQSLPVDEHLKIELSDDEKFGKWTGGSK